MSTAIEKVNGHAVDREPRFDHKAMAEADAIRTKAEAEAEQQRIAAEAQAEAVRIKAGEEAEALRLRNARNRRKDEREAAEHSLKMTKLQSEQQEIERASRKAAEDQRAKQRAEAEQQKAQEKTTKVWFGCALGFAIVCGIVALPVQMSAFYNKDALWLLAAPVFLEGGAWVVLQGARAAVEDGRPHWHYRLIAWLLAFIAAGVNLKHGLDKFDVATAIGTAFASVAGPGVWDLHEHGRIRKRDGKLSLKERWAKRKQDKKEAERLAKEEKRKDAEQQAREEAAKKADEQLAEERQERFPEVWEHALRLAAALGETTVTEPVWRRAHKDIEGTDPGETVDIIRNRNAAAKRVQAALSEGPGQKPVKATSSQRASQMPSAGKRRVYTPPTRRGVRRKGDTPKYVSAAAKQASIAAKQAAQSGK